MTSARLETTLRLYDKLAMAYAELHLFASTAEQHEQRSRIRHALIDVEALLAEHQHDDASDTSKQSVWPLPSASYDQAFGQVPN